MSGEKYVLTAGNVNEIKRVVNELSDNVSSIPGFDGILKYIKISIPNDLIEGFSYFIEVELSNEPDFSKSSIISSSDSSDKFWIFDEDRWSGIHPLSYADRGKAVLVDIESALKDKGKLYFGRYRWRCASLGLAGEYAGFTLGVSACTASASDSEASSLNHVQIIGPTTVNEKGSYKYSVTGILNSGDTVDVTSKATITSLCGFSYSKATNKITIGKIHKEMSDVIKTIVIYNGRIYEDAMTVLVKPVVLERIKLSLQDNLNVIHEDEKKSISVTAYYSDGSSKDVTAASTLTVDLADSTIVSGHFLSGAGPRSTFGLVAAAYADEDYPEEECSFTKYIKLICNDESGVDISVRMPEEISLDADNEYSYSIIALRNDGTEFDVTADCDVMPLNASGIEFIGGHITIDKDKLASSQFVYVMTAYHDTMHNGYKKTVNVDRIAILKNELHDVKLRFLNQNDQEIMAANEQTTISFDVKFDVMTENGVQSITPANGQFEIVCISENASIQPENRIRFGAFRTNETAIFKVTARMREKVIEKFFSIAVKAVFLEYIEIVGPSTVKESSQFEYKVRAAYSNHVVKDVDAFCSFSVLIGKPNLVTINKNMISFGEIEESYEQIVLLAEYKDVNFQTERAYKLVPVIINKAN